jgi:uncharacterized protein (TIGR01244 family)
MFTPLTDAFWVAGQIRPQDVAEAAARGVTAIVNNRPDGEEPGQPAGAEIERAARAAGLRYHHIPVAGGISGAQIEALAAAMAEGRTLAFCRSGTRSTYLWALASQRSGVDGATIIAEAEAAGFDLAPLRSYLG